MEPVTESVLKPEEKAVLVEARKLASLETQSLVKIIDRLAGALATERNRVGVRSDRIFRNASGK